MKKVKRIFSIILLFVVCLIIASARWAYSTYDSINFEEVLFHLNPRLTESGNEVIHDYLSGGLLVAVIMFMALLLIFKLVYDYMRGHNIDISIMFKKKTFNFNFTERVAKKFFNILIVVFLILMIIYSGHKIGIFDWAKNRILTSTFIDDNYVNPKKIKLEFPEKKRNLVYIFVESYESSYFSDDLGGLMDSNLLIELTKLTGDNINFSNGDKFGGAVQMDTLSWTSAGMVGQTAGIPLKIPSVISNETHFNDYLSGAYAIGDILDKEGYNQVLLLGSNAEFGNRDIYFKTHGNYEIYDYNAAIRNNKIPADYSVNWGFEDSKLFQFAREELIRLAEKDEPFNLTTLTTTTHFPNGYIEDSCVQRFSDQYSDAIYCSSIQIRDFVRWIQEQDFYEDTTIVIAGDHLTMQADYFDEKDFENRTIYNLFINSAISAENNKNRQFSSMDMYPTTLAALGVKIDGDKMGLGVNLFSDEKTIVEKYGQSKVNTELSKVSKFYNDKIIKNK